MINYFIKINSKINNRTSRNFGFTLTLVTFMLFLFRLIYYNEYILLLLPVCIVSSLFFYPKLIRIIFVFWTGVTNFIGNIILILLLVILFYSLITPISIGMKIFRRDRLNIKLIPRETYWNQRKYSISDFRKMY